MQFSAISPVTFLGEREVVLVPCLGFVILGTHSCFWLRHVSSLRYALRRRRRKWEGTIGPTTIWTLVLVSQSGSTEAQ